MTSPLSNDLPPAGDDSARPTAVSGTQAAATGASTAAESGGRAAAERPIVFFDGVCGLCNGFVDFALPRDRRGRLLFAPLQGETAREMLGRRDAESLKTVVLVDRRGVHRRSSA
ncbi:MAG TPA: DUF393 domain-containing protein, partial [Planctomycetaceae bacterium]|nr:DUF393 domain-containing protein [Planctomycetaceae bacterium]